MGMDLSGPAGPFSWNGFSWEKLLIVAEQYGWDPAGTTVGEEELKHMPDGVWNGGYMSNDYQVVMAEDAERLAAALERALPFIPNVDVLAQHAVEYDGILLVPDELVIPDTDWFCGLDSKDRIWEFIRYCRAGPFSIG